MSNSNKCLKQDNTTIQSKWARNVLQMGNDPEFRDNFREVFALIGVLQPEKWHPEGDAFIHTMMVLDSAAIVLHDPEWFLRRSYNEELYWALLCHDLGKALTTPNPNHSHHGHARRGIAPTISLMKRHGQPLGMINHVCFLVEYHMHIHQAFDLRPSTYVRIADAARGIVGDDADEIDKLCRNIRILGKCDNMGRGNYDPTIPYDNPRFMAAVLHGLLTHKFESDKEKQSYVKRIKEEFK